MEYRLNKIDTDLRQKVNNITKEGKVHASQNITINKDKREENKEHKNLELKRYNKSKKLAVDAVKVSDIEIEAFKESADITNKDKGKFIDVKK